jgi:ABC-type multidrug transport system ATPase subunit
VADAARLARRPAPRRPRRLAARLLGEVGLEDGVVLIGLSRGMRQRLGIARAW